MCECTAQYTLSRSTEDGLPHAITTVSPEQEPPIPIIRGMGRLCCLVVRVNGYRYRGPGFDPRRYQIF